MINKELLYKNPLRLIESEVGENFTQGRFGAILARAGVGKTAFVMQIALYGLLQDKKILHISLGDPIQKVSLWYEEVFRNITARYDSAAASKVWETVQAHRFIMTFQQDRFDANVLEERLTDLTEQGIFNPHMIIVDGLYFDEAPVALMAELKSLAAKFGVGVWFTARTHREDTLAKEAWPETFTPVADQFETILALEPEGNEIHVSVLKDGATPLGRVPLQLDPATMLIKTS